jgi:hypothetical protein
MPSRMVVAPDLDRWQSFTQAKNPVRTAQIENQPISVNEFDLGVRSTDKRVFNTHVAVFQAPDLKWSLETQMRPLTFGDLSRHLQSRDGRLFAMNVVELILPHFMRRLSGSCFREICKCKAIVEWCCKVLTVNVGFLVSAPLSPSADGVTIWALWRSQIFLPLILSGPFEILMLAAFAVLPVWTPRARRFFPSSVAQWSRHCNPRSGEPETKRPDRR